MAYIRLLDKVVEGHLANRDHVWRSPDKSDIFTIHLCD